jgi:hypothetical protein
MYLIIYKVKCGAGSAAILHLSKANWRRLDSLYLGKAPNIKETIILWVKTLS